MSATENRTISIWIDDKGLEEKLTSYNKKYESLNREIKKLEPGTDAFVKKSLEMEKVKRMIDQTEGQLSGKLGPTLRQLQDQQRKLNLELSQMPVELRKTSEAGMKLSAVNAKIAEVKAETNQTTAAMKRLNNEKQSMISKAVTGFGKAADSFNRFGGAVLAGVAAFSGVVFSFKKAVDAANEYEEALAELSALTGLAGKELDYLSQEAIKFSTSTVEGGVRITKSAKDIVDAYKLVGAQRPELLKNKEALNEVTKQALILSEAAKIDLGEAVKGVTTVLNQFNEGGDQAARIVNALAAGSKEGAAEVDYISDALNRAGTVASTSGVSIEQTIGLIETMAPRFASSEQAGTALRGTLLKLTTGADEFNPKIVGLETALDNLAKKNLSANDMLKMFGEQNITAASILIKYRDEVKSYTSAVTGTNVAVEQASINTATNTARLAQNRNEIAKNTIELGQKLAPAMVLVTGVWNKFLTGLNKFTETPLSKKLEQEAVSLRKTELQIISGNISQENRIKLIQQLQNNYPQYLGNINAETISNQQLQKALQGVNASLINKIIIQKQQEKIDDLAEVQAKEKERELKKLMELEDAITKAAAKYNITLKEGVSIQQQAVHVLSKIDYDDGIFFGTKKDIRSALSDYAYLVERGQQLNGAANDLVKQREELKKRLGMVDEEAPTDKPVEEAKKVDDPFSVGGGDDKASKAAKKLADKKLKEAQDELDRIYKLQVAEFERQFKAAEDAADDEFKLLVKTNKEKFDEIKRFYDAEVAAALDYAIISAETDDERHLAVIDKIRTQAQEKLALLEENSYQYKMVEAQMNADIEAEENNHLMRRAQKIEGFLNEAAGLYQAFAAKTQAHTNQKLNEQRKADEIEKAALKKKLDDNVITQEQYDAQIAHIDKIAAMRERTAQKDAAEAQKAFAVFESAVKTALLWVAAYIDPSKIPAAIAASVKTALIMSTPIPEYYEGGYLPKTGNDREAFPIIAHGNEYMVPANEMRDPAVANFAAMVETSRTGGASVSQQMSQMQTNQQTVVMQSGSQIDPNFFPLMERLLNVLENGISAPIVLDDEVKFKLNRELKKQEIKDTNDVF